MTTEKFADPGWSATGIEPAGIEPAAVGSRSAVRRAALAARSRASAGVARVRAEGPERVRQAGRTVQGNRFPVGAVLLAALGAAAIVVSRRRAAARAAADRGPLAFLRRSR